jgi:hypothetical protein
VKLGGLPACFQNKSKLLAFYWGSAGLAGISKIRQGSFGFLWWSGHSVEGSFFRFALRTPLRVQQGLVVVVASGARL